MRNPSNGFAVGDTVIMLDHDETRENSNYDYLIGETGTVLDTSAGMNEERPHDIIRVEFHDSKDVHSIYHWRVARTNIKPNWEV